MKDTNSCSTLCTCMNLSWEGGWGGGWGIVLPIVRGWGARHIF